uniref:Uncharacterized protein n=1 Tax=Plectus sambesii TaxID=2011161 RepID=A0A914VMV2_9BILA
MGRAFVSLIKKLLNGIENLQNKEMLVGKIALDGCIRMGGAFLSLMKKQSNENQQSKETLVDNVVLDGCIRMGEVFHDLMKKLLNGIEEQQSKGMHKHKLI